MSNPGFPPSNGVRWLHNGHELKGKTSFVLSFNHAEVRSSGNYSCVPFNRVGMAQPAASSIRIHSPPSFVQSLPPISGKCTTIYMQFILIRNGLVRNSFSCGIFITARSNNFFSWKTFSFKKLKIVCKNIHEKNGR